MLSSFLTKPDTIIIKDCPTPEPGPGEVRIRLKMTGICGSDVHFFHLGRPDNSPLTLGHEGVGIIDKTGTGVINHAIGDKIVIEPNIPCYNCPECQGGRSNICRNKRIKGVTENGCFAEYVIVPEDFAHKLPSGISDNDAVSIEPAAVALSALIRSKSQPGDTIAVIGLGSVGLLITHIAVAFGYKVLVTDLIKSKVNLAVEMGAIAVKPKTDAKANIDHIQKIFHDEEVISIFECAGSDKVVTLISQVAPRGAEILLMGLTDKMAAINPMSILKNGNFINPSLIYEHPVDYKRTIRLISSGIIHPGFIVSDFYSLNETQKALEQASQGKESKIVIRINPK